MLRYTAIISYFERYYASAFRHYVVILITRHSLLPCVTLFIFADIY